MINIIFQLKIPARWALNIIPISLANATLNGRMRFDLLGWGYAKCQYLHPSSSNPYILHEIVYIPFNLVGRATCKMLFEKEKYAANLSCASPENIAHRTSRVIINSIIFIIFLYLYTLKSDNRGTGFRSFLELI